MKTTPNEGVLRLRLALPLLIGILSVAPPVWADPPPRQVHVMISGGFTAAYEALVPYFEAASGIRVLTVHGPSMGAAPHAIPNRLARGEAADVVILAGSALDELIGQGKIIPGSKADLAQSLVAVAVKEGTPLPNMRTTSELAKVLLAARSIAVSASASGVYVSSELVRTLGIENQVRDKILVVKTEPVGKVVARGEAEVGFQQLSELKPIQGIAIAGLLPAEVQKVTAFSAGMVQGAADEDAGQELIRFLKSQDAKPAIRRAGMVPAEAAGQLRQK
jgi:molybdate transport system substrate-binding protein